MIKNRRFAAVFAVTVWVLSVLYGSYRGASALAEDVTEPYTQGIYDGEGHYWKPSIAKQLEVRIDASLSAAAVLQRYPFMTTHAERVLTARRELIRSSPVGVKNYYNNMLTIAFDKMIEAARDNINAIDETDIDDIVYYESIMSGAQILIDNAAEVGCTREVVYSTELSQFPGIIWKSLLHPTPFFPSNVNVVTEADYEAFMTEKGV